MYLLSENLLQLVLRESLYSFSEEADYFGGKDYNYSVFEEWLQCYQQPDMVNMIDHDGRTIWFEVK